MTAVLSDTDTTASIDEALAAIVQAWSVAAQACISCGACSPRCELLDSDGVDIGSLAKEGLDLLNSVSVGPLTETLDTGALSDAVRDYVTENQLLYTIVRRCAICTRCTAFCPTEVSVAAVMRAWRRLFALTGVLRVEDSKSVAVDNEWHIFSVYRAVYGIAYGDLPLLSSIQPGAADTLFFPGCSLVSYAPDLTRCVCRWLSQQGISYALSDSCCGSPLNSAGLVDRAERMKESLQEQIRRVGIKRVVTVCAGCGEELHATFDEDIEIVPLPRLLVEAGEKISTSGRTGLDASARYALFDSCHDRGGEHGKALRTLLSAYPLVELAHQGRDTLCCGAGGAVSSFDSELCTRRVACVLGECVAAGADVVVSSCPTCTYTFADALIKAHASGTYASLESRHYLELLFDQPIDWTRVFGELQGMWSGEYGAWVCAQLL